MRGRREKFDDKFPPASLKEKWIKIFKFADYKIFWKAFSSFHKDFNGHNGHFIFEILVFSQFVLEEIQ